VILNLNNLSFDSSVEYRLPISGGRKARYIDDNFGCFENFDNFLALLTILLFKLLTREEERRRAAEEAEAAAAAARALTAEEEEELANAPPPVLPYSSMFIFSSTNPFRCAIHAIVTFPLFDVFIMLVRIGRSIVFFYIKHLLLFKGYYWLFHCLGCWRSCQCQQFMEQEADLLWLWVHMCLRHWSFIKGNYFSWNWNIVRMII